MALAACNPVVEQAVAPHHPNVIIIHTDAWRAQAFGFAGDPNATTPHLDALAKSAYVFSTAVAELPMCTPSRASLLTGQLPFEHELIQNHLQLDTNAVTMGKIFASAGYRTAFIGKWHLDANGLENFTPPGPRRQGFQYWKALEYTHKYWQSPYFHDSPEKKFWEGYDAKAQTTDAIQWISEQEKSTDPFLLFLSLGPPHAPYHKAPEGYKAMYKDRELIPRKNVPQSRSYSARMQLEGYYAHGSAIDWQVGRIIEALKASGADQNTILVFTSDHGDMLGSQNRDANQEPFDESILVPLIVSVPGHPGTGRKPIRSPIGRADILPTLLRLCGLKKPKSVTGSDYSGWITGQQAVAEDVMVPIYCVNPDEAWGRLGGRPYRGFRTERYTYVRDLTGPWLLYDNTTDPYQLHNLVKEPSQKALVQRMDNLLQVHLDNSGDEFLPGKTYLKMYGYPE